MKMVIPDIASAIGLGVLGNWATSLISIGFSKCFGEKEDLLMNKVYAAADRAADSFLKRYNHTYGKLD
ncbi:MAG: hypothetical protein JW915_08495 [Chitinispirillaceae bacterium]|nr:hypothetical protein [Chitinispirillaceae bacterium]